MDDDPQERVRRGQWMAHDGMIWIEDMLDEHLLNAYRTCVRHDNPKQIELLAEIEDRNLDWRLKVSQARHKRR
jgi:hypothetical protein